MKTLKTLKECVCESRCRKGAPDGTTKRGAFWLACQPILVRSYGGDGIGNNAIDWQNHLCIRHFRDGAVRAVVRASGWHQNGSPDDVYVAADEILDCKTVEDVIVSLKGMDIGYKTHAYSDLCREYITKSLTALGLEEIEPAPDRD